MAYILLSLRTIWYCLFKERWINRNVAYTLTGIDNSHFNIKHFIQMPSCVSSSANRAIHITWVSYKTFILKQTLPNYNLIHVEAWQKLDRCTLILQTFTHMGNICHAHILSCGHESFSTSSFFETRSFP